MPGRSNVRPVRIHAHVHVISRAEGSHPARTAGAVISGVTVYVAATVRAAVVVGPVPIVLLVHPRAQHAALHTEDLLDAKADGLRVRVLLQVRPRYPGVIHGLRCASPQLQREEQSLLHAPIPGLNVWVYSARAPVVIYRVFVCAYVCFFGVYAGKQRSTVAPQPLCRPRGHTSKCQIDSTRRLGLNPTG